MAALSWEQVARRGWRTPLALCLEAGRLAAVGRVPAVSVDDTDAVASALAWATREPAALECDSQGRYRPVVMGPFPVGSQHWLDSHREAAVSGVLTPLELVKNGDAHHYGQLANLDAAEVSYQLAVDSDDADAAALASLRLAELAEQRDQPAEAASRYAAVAELNHPVASPMAVLRLARYATQDGDRPKARALAHQVVASDNPALLREAWDLLGSLAWLDDDRDAAVAAMRQAIDAAGPWHPAHTRRLAAMLAACGDISGAADAYRTLLGVHLLSDDTDPGEYVQLMAAAGRIDEAVAVLEEVAAHDGLFIGHVLLALVSAHAIREDIAAAWQAIARVRAHFTVRFPEVSVQADVFEAMLALADGDDEHAAKLCRSLTDSDDMEVRDLARPLLIAAGDHFAADRKICVIPGARPLLEFLSEAASPATAAWAASSLAHLAMVEGRLDDVDAAVHLAARHLSTDEVTILLRQLLHRSSYEAPDPSQ
jgi:lipopolysaccharide biosynthesis regulator YciM